MGSAFRAAAGLGALIVLAIPAAASYGYDYYDEAYASSDGYYYGDDFAYGPSAAEESGGSNAPLVETRGGDKKTGALAQVTGGERVEQGDYDFVVAVGRFGVVSCGGWLYSDGVVVTAAHCLPAFGPVGMSVYTGRYDLLAPFNASQQYPVVAALPHPMYDPATHAFDVALLKLNRPVETSFEATAQEPDCAEARSAFWEVEPGAELTVLGWGVDDARSSHVSRYLLKGTVTYMPRDECAAAYAAGSGAVVGASMICAAASGTQDACTGDGGGPLLMATPSGDVVLGIVSWGEGCDVAGKPGVYTSIAAVKAWIDDVAGAL